MRLGMILIAACGATPAPVPPPVHNVAPPDAAIDAAAISIDAVVDDAEPEDERDPYLRVVTQHMTNIRHCYAAELEKDPTASGHLKVTFTVEPDGHADQITITGMNATMQACLSQLWITLPFPTAKEAITLTFPFQLVAQ